MLSLTECVDLCGLSNDEVAVIAEHEHVPEIVAAELASHLLQSHDGQCRLKRFMLETLERATYRGQFDKASRIAAMYRRFDSEHP